MGLRSPAINIISSKTSVDSRTKPSVGRSKKYSNKITATVPNMNTFFRAAVPSEAPSVVAVVAKDGSEGLEVRLSRAAAVSLKVISTIPVTS